MQREKLPDFTNACRAPASFAAAQFPIVKRDVSGASKLTSLAQESRPRAHCTPPPAKVNAINRAEPETLVYKLYFISLIVRPTSAEYTSRLSADARSPLSRGIYGTVRSRLPPRGSGQIFFCLADDSPLSFAKFARRDTRLHRRMATSSPSPPSCSHGKPR